MPEYYLELKRINDHAIVYYGVKSGKIRTNIMAIYGKYDDFILTNLDNGFLLTL